MSYKYTLVGDTNGNQNITVFSTRVYTADQTHPYFDEIKAGLENGNESVIELFDLGETVARKFERVSDRVSVANGHVYFDGDEIESALAKQIIRFMNEGVEDWKPLVAFFEKVQQNPNHHSRIQLHDWLNAHDFTITDSGDIVGYKGVHKDYNVTDGTFNFVSGASGRAIVDGVVVTGRIPNEIGSVVEMPRSEVVHDPSNSCSSGLHVGTYTYAQQFARGAMLKVHVNPRDVVSVPTDASGEKVRVCRYRVVEVIDAPETVAVVRDWDDDEEDVEYCDECGEPLFVGDYCNHDEDEEDDERYSYPW